MAGLRGNQAWFMAAKQTAKGTAATPAALTTYKTPFSGGNIGPVRETDNLAETDSNRDRGIAFVTTTGVEGSPEQYVRDAPIGFWLWAALGADAVTGTTNYSHVITPANSLPYITVWKSMADTLWEQYRDCKVSQIVIGAEAGQPLTATVDINGLVPTRLTTDPSVTPAIALQSGPVYNFNNATVTLGGSATALVRSFELTINNNVARQQTDDVVPYDVVEGTREVDLSFDLIFETIDEYAKFHTGSASGTTESPDIYTTSALFSLSKGANNSIAFNLPNIAYTDMPVEPNTAGDPVVVSVSAVGQRTVGTPIVTATVANQVATY